VAEFSFTYRAFISYSHADHDWGVWLHRALERYRVPKRLSGAEGLRRLGRMFRDEEELGAAHELGPKIEAALKASDVLIVVCSPRSAKSQWVNQEIEAFKKLGREHRVFALIVDGEPHDVEKECFPEALKRRVDGGPAEPLAVDVRKFGREDAALRLIAGMLEVGYDDLRQREVRRRRAELRRAQALFVSGLVLVAAALTGGYFAAANYVDASERSSALFAREANTLFDEGLHAKGMLMALYGDPAARAGAIEALFRPEGYPAARNALVRASLHNRLTATYSGHTSHVLAIDVHPDGSTFLSASDDNTVKLWRGGSGEAVATFAGHEELVDAVEFLPDGRRFLTASRDSTVKLWDVSRPEALQTFAVEDLTALTVAPDGEHFFAGDSDGVVRQWRLDRQEPVATWPLEDAGIAQIVALPDGERFLTSTHFGGVKLWRIGQATPLGVYRADGGQVETIALLPDGQRFLIGDDDGGVELWDFARDEAVENFYGHRETVWSIALHPDGERFVTASDDGTVRLWREDSISALATFTMPTERINLFGPGNSVRAVAFLPDGSCLVGAYDGAVKRLQIDGDPPAASYTAGKGGVYSLAFLPDGQRFLAGALQNETQLWRRDGQQPDQTFSNGGSGFATPTLSIAIAPDGERFVTSTISGAVTMWEIGRQGALASFEHGGGYVFDAAFLPDGAQMLTASSDGAIRLWRTADASLVQTFKEHDAFVRAIAVSPDGRQFISGSDDGTARLWRIEEENSVATFGGHGFVLADVAVTADGSRFLTGSLDGTVKQWRAGRKTPLTTAGASIPDVYSIALSPDGRHYAAGSSGATLLMALGDELPLARFQADGDSSILAVTFSTDGTEVMSGSNVNGMARLWKIPEFIFLPKDEQVRQTCDSLAAIGAMEFTEADYVRFPILDREAPHPCRHVWGFDPRVKREAEAVN
jgi:WD40 repeat protein